MKSTVRLSASDPAGIAAAAEILRGGGLVAFPTETVYGLGAVGLDPVAVERIFAAKERPHSDPVILHVADREWVRDLVRAVPETAGHLMAAFWPGPLTLVLPRSERVPLLVTAGSEGVAVRMPDHPVALELIRQVGVPVAAPSANLFSRPSPTTADHVLQDLDRRIDAVLDGGEATVGVESTVLDLRGERPVVLRPGGVTREEIEAVLGVAILQRASTSAPAETVASPGLLEKHYSPRAEVFLFDGPDEAVFPALRKLAADQSGMVVLACSEDLPALSGLTTAELGSRSRLEEVAHRLYAEFRRLDAQGVSAIAIRTVPAGGLGDAINDRLRRAASGRVLTPR